MATDKIAIEMDLRERYVRDTLLNYWNIELKGKFILHKAMHKDFSKHKKVQIFKGTWIMVPPGETPEAAIKRFDEKYINTTIGNQIKKKNNGRLL